MEHTRPASFGLRPLGERKPAPERATHLERHRQEVAAALDAARRGHVLTPAEASAVCVEVRTLRAALRQCGDVLRRSHHYTAAAFVAALLEDR